MFRKRLLASTCATCFLATAATAQQAKTKADFMILLDRSVSMRTPLKTVRNQLDLFFKKVNDPANRIDGRVTLILFGGDPELAVPFTSTQNAKRVLDAIDNVKINTNYPEAGLEAIRVALNAASLGTRFPQPPTFRSDALRNVILITDEDSDAPSHATNRMMGQDGPKSGNKGTVEPPFTQSHLNRFPWAPWQAEIEDAAKAIVDNDAFLNIVLRKSDKVRGRTSPLRQYGNPLATVLDNGHFNRQATLDKLDTTESKHSLQARVLALSKPSAEQPPRLLARTFDIQGSQWAERLFAAKFDETTCPCPNQASTLRYGASSNGLGQLPRLDLVGRPKVCQDVRLELQRRAAADAAACILFSTRGLPTPAAKWWGQCHIDMRLGFESAELLRGQKSGWTLRIPCNDLTACGRELFVQGVFLDSDQSTGVAYTNGLRITVGN